MSWEEYYPTRVTHGTERYYERTTLELALGVARDWIDEWDYNQDAHGYCHERSIIMRLLYAIENGERP